MPSTYEELPPCPPEEISVFSLAARVAALEKDRKKCACNEDVSSSGATSAPRHASAAEVASRIVESGPDEQGGKVKWTEVANRSTIRKQKKQANRKLLSMAVKDVPVVVGTASEFPNCAVKGARPTKALFVSNLERCPPVEITNLMKERGIIPWDVHCTSKKTLPVASFRVTIREDDLQKALTPDFWPNGVRCREWVPNVRRQRQNDAVPAVPSLPRQEEIVDHSDNPVDGEHSNHHG